MQTECVLEAPGAAAVSVQVRFLRVQREGRRGGARAEGDAFTPVASLEVDGELWTTWEESSEQQIDLGPVALGSLVRAGTCGGQRDGDHARRPRRAGAAAGRLGPYRRPCRT